MRASVICVLFSMLSAFAADTRSPTAVTVILDFEGQHPSRAIRLMERETERILKDSDLHLDWVLREDAVSKAFPDLVVLRFKGNCGLEPSIREPEDVGVLAFTYTTDGVVQPFSQVACDKIGAFLLSGRRKGSSYTDPEKVMGVALGRVVAHELVHMLLGSGTHAETGVFKPGLTVEQLVSGELELDEGDVDRLRAGH
jgi:hypothetical protein